MVVKITQFYVKILLVMRFIFCSIKALKTWGLLHRDPHLKLQTKTIFHVLEVPRDQGQRSRDHISTAVPFRRQTTPR